MKVILCAFLFVLPCLAADPFDAEQPPGSGNPDAATVRVELERYDLPLQEITALSAAARSQAGLDLRAAVQKAAVPAGLTCFDLEEGKENRSRSETEIYIPTSWTVKPDKNGVPRIQQDGTERRGLETGEFATASLLPGGHVRLLMTTTRRDCPGRQKWAEGDGTVEFPVIASSEVTAEAILPAGQWTLWGIERLPREGLRNDQEFPSEKRRITFVRALRDEPAAPEKAAAEQPRPLPMPGRTLLCEWIHTDTDTAASLMEQHSPLAGQELRAGAAAAVQAGKASPGEVSAVQLLHGVKFGVSAWAAYHFPEKLNRQSADAPAVFSDSESLLKLEGEASHDAAADIWSLRIESRRTELIGTLPAEPGQPAESLSVCYPRTRRMDYDGDVAIPSGQTRLAAVIPALESGQADAGKVALMFLTVLP